MEEGLFPKRSANWLLLIIIATVYYGVYYAFVYSKLYSLVSTQYVVGSPYTSEQICTGSSANPKFKVYIYQPKAISEFTERGVQVKVITDSDPITTLTLTLNSDLPQNVYYKVNVATVRTNVRLSPFDSGISLSDSITLENMAPQSSKTVVFWLYLSRLDNSEQNQSEQSQEISLELLCFIDAKTTNQPNSVNGISLPTIPYDTSSALRDSFISVALLPPWSNIVLFVLAIGVVKIVEESIPHYTNDEGENLPPCKGDSLVSWKGLKLILLVLAYSLVLYGMTMRLVGL